MNYQVDFWSAVKGNWQFDMFFATIQEAEAEKRILELNNVEARIIEL